MKINIDAESFGTLLVESSIDAIIAIDTSRGITAWNKAAEYLFERSRDEAIGRPLDEVIPSIESDRDLNEAIHHAENGRQSFLPAKKDIAHRQHVEMHIVPLLHNGMQVGVMLLMHDVSHRIVKEDQLKYVNRELQKRLRQIKLSERELSHLTHVATHNIREPIRTIYTTIERLIREEAAVLSNNGKASFRRIQSSLNRINLLVEDIITLSQINIAEQPTGRVNLLEIIALVNKALEQKIRETGAEITAGDLCEIRAHRNQLLLMLQQLISYAIKFNTNPTPVIHIECRKADSKVDAPDGYPDEYYLLELVHNGPPYEIDPKIIFDNVEPQNEKMKSSAEMVAITVKVMEAHAGLLFFEQTPKGDTMVKCYFPA